MVGIILVCLTTHIVSTYFGCYGELLIFWGIVSAIGLRKRALLKPALYGHCIVLCQQISVATSEPMVSVISYVPIYILRYVFLDCIPKKIKHVALLLVPSLVLSFRFQDQDTATLIALLTVLVLPIYGKNSRTEEVSWVCPPITLHYKSIAIYATLLLLGSGFLFFPSGNGENPKTAIIAGGQWARADVELPPIKNLRISWSYGYSELRQLLESPIIPVLDLSEKIEEAWLITPTDTFSVAQIDHVHEWVGNGGHLVVVTDHTDLYGHGRVVNSLLGRFGLETSLTAFFPRNPTDKAKVSCASSVALKTANVQYGRFLWPTVTARWWNENVDYSAKNFFGGLMPTGDDQLGRRVISGVTAVGKGAITLFGDSTVLANFAIYQPGIISLIETIRYRWRVSRICPLSWALLLIGALLFLTNRSRSFIFAIPIVGIWAVTAFGKTPSTWSEYIYFSGDERAFFEFGDPRERISTSFSVIPISGIRPRWVSNADSDEAGIWVGPNPPPKNTWRWIDTISSEGNSETYDSRLDPLFTILSNSTPKIWPEELNMKRLKAQGIWTDEVVGDWWYGNGISQSKQRRFSSLLSWIQGEPAATAIRPVICDSDEFNDYLIKMEGVGVQNLVLPAINMIPETEIYLGRGVSAVVVEIDGTFGLFGNRPFTESWNAPKAWSLVPLVKNGALDPDDFVH